MYMYIYTATDDFYQKFTHLRFLSFRELAMEILSHQPEGSFIVRKSASNPGSFALSLKGPQDKISHYLIERNGGFKLQV